MNIIPIGDRVVIKQIEAEEKTKSGIVLTSAAKEKPPIFEVVVVGDGKQSDGTEIKMIVKVGDKVVANKHAAFPAKINDEDVYVIPQNEIKAFIID
ncbi:MAG: co-chaperone GroES [Oscillospiraceae bacterium]|nr:co-chaperone GroES [Oscillospiraceae bacterium]